MGNHFWLAVAALLVSAGFVGFIWFIIFCTQGKLAVCQ